MTVLDIVKAINPKNARVDIVQRENMLTTKEHTLSAGEAIKTPIEYSDCEVHQIDLMFAPQPVEPVLVLHI